MISWMVIGILVIIAVLALKMNHLRHRIWILMLVFLALFLYTSAAIVYSENELKFNTMDGIFSSARIYIGWLGNGFQNLKALSGKAVDMDWTDSNETFVNQNLEKIAPKTR